MQIYLIAETNDFFDTISYPVLDYQFSNASISVVKQSGSVACKRVSMRLRYSELEKVREQDGASVNHPTCVVKYRLHERVPVAYCHPFWTILSQLSHVELSSFYILIRVFLVSISNGYAQ